MKKLLFAWLLAMPAICFSQRVFDLSHIQAPGLPTLSEAGSVTAFGTTAGTASSPQIVTVSGAYLVGDCLITWPSGFEGSLDGSSYASTQTVSHSGAAFAGQPVNVYTRLSASATTGSYSGNITFASSSAATVSLAVSGSVSSGSVSTTHYRAVSIPSSGVAGGADLSSFPMTFQGTYPDLATVSNGGFVQNGSGNDIIFALDNAGTTLCKWEIENWNPTTGQITAHVKLPTLSATATTTIYLLYGNTAVTTFQGGAPGSVWDASYKDVWHFNETITAAGQTVHDYTSNGNNFTTAGTWSSGQQVTGKVGGALSNLKANGNYLTLGAQQDYAGDLTVEGWYYVPGTGTITDNAFWLVDDWESTNFPYTNASTQHFEYYIWNGSVVPADNVAVNNGTWYYVVEQHHGDGSVETIFHNGVAQTSVASGSYTLSFIRLGSNVNQSDISSDKYCDEIRVSSTLRSAGWITTTYNNQSNPSAWYSVGARN